MDTAVAAAVIPLVIFGLVIVIGILDPATHEAREDIRNRKIIAWLKKDLPPLEPAVDWGDFEDRIERGLQMGQNITPDTVQQTVRLAQSYAKACGHFRREEFYLVGDSVEYRICLDCGQALTKDGEPTALPATYETWPTPP